MDRTGFAEREAGVEAILRGYHEYVAGRFERWLADRADAPDGDDVVGCVYRCRVSADVAEVKRLCVRDAYRGRGLGRDPANTVVGRAADAGFATLRLDAASFTRSAVGLHRTWGSRRSRAASRSRTFRLRSATG